MIICDGTGCLRNLPFCQSIVLFSKGIACVVQSPVSKVDDDGFVCPRKANLG